MSQSRRKKKKKKKISPIENHSERHEIIERCFHIHRMEIEIGSAIPATNFNNRRLWFARLLFDRVSASSPTYSWCQLRIIFVLKATTGSLSIAWPSRARHSINVESRRANAVLRKSRFVPSPEFWQTESSTPSRESSSWSILNNFTRGKFGEFVRTFDRHLEHRSLVIPRFRVSNELNFENVLYSYSISIIIIFDHTLYLFGQ